MSSTAKDLREGTRQALIDADLATTGQVFFSRMPATPDRALAITVYPVSVPHTTGVQVRVRGKAGSTVDAEDWADTIRPALHGLTDRQWGTTRLQQLAFVSAARLGVDANNRDEVALNFYATTSDPTVSLTD